MDFLKKLSFITSVRSLKKQERFRKKSTSALLITPKPLTVWITTNWKILQYQITWPTSWEICMQVKKQQVKLDMEQQTGSKSGKEYEKAVYCHPAYLTYMESTSYEMLGWMKHKLESRLPGETAITSDKHMIMAERGKLKSLLMKVKEESENVGLKLTIKKLRSWHLVPSLHSK